jgi:hypothetical protein
MKLSKEKLRVFIVLLFFVLTLCVANTLFAAEYARPLGDDPESHSDVKLYIPLGDEGDKYINTQNNAIHYGWAITGVDVADHSRKYLDSEGKEVEGADNGGTSSANLFDIPLVRTFDILLASGTTTEASFDVVADLWRSTANTPGLTTNMTNNLINDNTAIRSNASRIPVKLEDGIYTLNVYIYRTANARNTTPTQHVFKFSIKKADTSNDPEQEDVVSISIANPPARIEYLEGQKFDPAGMTVTAVLKDGSTAEIVGFKFPEEPLKLEDTEVTIYFGEGEYKRTVPLSINVKPSTGIANVRISNGQMYNDWVMTGVGGDRDFIRKKDRYDAIALYGQTVGKFSFDASEAAEVYVNNETKPRMMGDDGLYYVELPAGNIDEYNGLTSTVTVKIGVEEKKYTFMCFVQEKTRMPSEITEYLCMASQYTNGSIWGAYGLNPVHTLRGCDLYQTASGINGMYYGPTSLGNFGGYIVYRFDEPIKDDPMNPYGVDFIVYGNCSTANTGFSEPGNVLVSDDGLKWYTLAGSVHYDDCALWDYSVIYKNENGKAVATVDGKSVTVYQYPEKQRYPLFPWTRELEQSMKLTGVMLVASGEDDGYGSTTALHPDFGYADTGWLNDNPKADNPYVGKQGGERLNNEGFDLKWAVDENGQPVDLSRKEIRYIKIQTANFVINGAIGEKSTEVNGVRVVEPSNTEVYATSMPNGITIDGRPVNLTLGTEVYNSVAVGGAFLVDVDAQEGANIYINGDRGTTRAFARMPEHKMLRVIVQDGIKAPWIGYFNLVDVGGEGDPFSIITFNAAGGDIEGNKTRVYMPSQAENDKVFPIPTRFNHTFRGWDDGTGNKYSSYVESLPEELTLTAQWDYNVPVDNSGPGYATALHPSDEKWILPSSSNLRLPTSVKTLIFGDLTNGVKQDSDGIIKTYEAIAALEGMVVKDETTIGEQKGALSDSRAVLKGLDDDARKALGVGTAADKLLQLPPIQGTISDLTGTATALISHKVTFGAKFAGTRLFSIEVLKLKNDKKTTIQLQRQAESEMPENLAHRQYIWTDIQGKKYGPDWIIEQDDEMFLRVAVEDNSDLDWDYETNGSVLDPVILAAPSAASGGVGYEPSGGCNAGLGFAAGIGLLFAAALLRHRGRGTK